MRPRSCQRQSWQVRYLLTALYLADSEESPTAGIEEVASIDVFASNLDGEADWELANVKESTDLVEPVFVATMVFDVRRALRLVNPLIFCYGLSVIGDTRR